MEQQAVMAGRREEAVGGEGMLKSQGLAATREMRRTESGEEEIT